MKCEIDVWKNTINKLFLNHFRWKHLLSIPIFYLLRIFMINKIQINLKEFKNEVEKNIFLSSLHSQRITDEEIWYNNLNQLKKYIEKNKKDNKKT